jgi:putative proteasome-type protease
MDSTLNSNISVGLPLDLLVYENNSFKPSKLVTLDESNPYFQMIHQLWGEKLRSAFNSIAEPSWNGADKSSAISAPAKKMGPVPIHLLLKKGKSSHNTPKQTKPSKKTALKKKA